MEVEGLRLLAERGEIALLASEMRCRLADDDVWSPEDAMQVSVLLIIAAEALGADALYVNFCEPLKRHHEAVHWLATLKLRARAIEIFEGLEATVVWLQDSADATSEGGSSAGGYPLALAARRLRIAGRAEEAAPLPEEAVGRATSGVQWYLSEILGEMGHYQLQLGHIDLAFEYFRAVLVQEYVRGAVSADQLEKMCQGLAEMLGQVDYQIELQRNIAEQAEERAHPIPMVAWAAAAAQLAAIGVWGEAQSALRRAAAISDASKREVDRSFGAYCRAMARLLDPQEMSAADVAGACRDAARVFRKTLPLPHNDDVPVWGAMLRKVRETRGDAEHLGAAIILSTLRARQAEASGRLEDALILYAEIGYRSEAPCQLASERRARILLTLGRPGSRQSYLAW